MSKTVGCRTAELFDDEMQMPFPTVVMYPSSAPEKPERLGPYAVSVAMNGPIEAGAFPLVVISHGTGGSHLVYRTLAAHLARHGFVVAMPEHPRNNRNNNELAGTVANLANRPRHIRLVIDWAFSQGAFGGSLLPDAVAIVGHSMGGYTALATAGGLPMALPNETADGKPQAVSVTPDSRVKALVLLAPATPWFMAPGALQGVRVPILMLTGEKDVHTHEGHAEIVKRGLPEGTRLEHRVVPNAGHFAFLSPFPESMNSPAFPPSQDPPGFDRARFHEEMNAEIEAFLRRVL
ncbi:alpha/beta hydrolase family protein [Polyangium aurulentum]|uniref:alpha/beta hydrolase family protein n=1 Tax=Polyangium aurulentum TaxID=2567896 RepID=UPI0010ADAEA8|nr:alpha/beta fold hydrolase [Polyangium aurulentum]UQA59807.1 dienelactone hydrolase family protein [Polyangium aurulentum]